MTDQLLDELIVYLRQARALERLDLRLLDCGVSRARDEAVREIYRKHLIETEQHLWMIEDRLAAHAARPEPAAEQEAVGALSVAFADADAHTPTQLAVSAYAFESLEIAVYHLVGHVAQRAGATETALVAQAILEEEEQAAELLAGSFDRALVASLAGSS